MKHETEVSLLEYAKGMKVSFKKNNAGTLRFFKIDQLGVCTPVVQIAGDKSNTAYARCTNISPLKPLIT